MICCLKLELTDFFFFYRRRCGRTVGQFAVGGRVPEADRAVRRQTVLVAGSSDACPPAAAARALRQAPARQHRQRPDLPADRQRLRRQQPDHPRADRQGVPSRLLDAFPSLIFDPIVFNGCLFFLSNAVDSVPGAETQLQQSERRSFEAFRPAPIQRRGGDLRSAFVFWKH